MVGDYDSDCGRRSCRSDMTLTGLRFSILGGYKFVYLGPTIWVGVPGGGNAERVYSPTAVFTLRLGLPFGNHSKARNLTAR